MRIRIDEGAAAIGVSNASVWKLAYSQSPLSLPLDAEAITAHVDMASWADEGSVDQGYRDVLLQLGYPNVEPAGEKLRRVVRERGFRSYGLLIDACNLVSVKYSAGIGLHDITLIEQSGDDFWVWRARGEERIVPAFRNKPKIIPEGDLAYGLRNSARTEVLAWLGKQDVDAASCQIGDNTRVVLVVALGHRFLTREDTKRMCKEIVGIVRDNDNDVEADALFPAVVSRS